MRDIRVAAIPKRSTTSQGRIDAQSQLATFERIQADRGNAIGRNLGIQDIGQGERGLRRRLEGEFILRPPQHPAQYTYPVYSCQRAVVGELRQIRGVWVARYSATQDRG
jgi:hypothetical protein